jgi:hypothetical protein
VWRRASCSEHYRLPVTSQCEKTLRQVNRCRGTIYRTFSRFRGRPGPWSCFGPPAQQMSPRTDAVASESRGSPTLSHPFATTMSGRVRFRGSPPENSQTRNTFETAMMDTKSAIATRDELIRNPGMRRPHVVILGSGASRATGPDGDLNGRRLPTMEDWSRFSNLIVYSYKTVSTLRMNTLNLCTALCIPILHIAD